MNSFVDSEQVNLSIVPVNAHGVSCPTFLQAPTVIAIVPDDSGHLRNDHEAYAAGSAIAEVILAPLSSSSAPVRSRAQKNRYDHDRFACVCSLSEFGAYSLKISWNHKR